MLDIISPKPILYDSIIGLIAVSDEIFAKNEVVYGDILFQRSSEVREEAGQSNVYLDQNQSATFGGFVIRGRATVQFNPVFFNYLLKTYLLRKEITNRSGGSTRFNIGQESLKEVPVHITTDSSEQQKIASFLTAVDEKISALQRKLELLQTYKRGVMQKLFSQEIRFKREDGSSFPDWEEKKLGELGTFTGGGTPSKANEDYWTGSIPWVSSSDIDEDSIHKISITRYITEAALNESATKVVPANSILLVSRVGVGKLAVTHVELCTSQDFTSFTPKNNNLYFLAYFLKANVNTFKSFNQGTSIKGFSKRDLQQLPVGVPQLEEQQKIASFLSALDSKIDAVNQQISLTEQFKKGLLQQMFV